MPSLSEVRFISVISVLRFSLLFAVLSACLSAVPKILNYAGQVSVDGQRFDGEAKLKFALVNPSGSATYWSQDGTSANGSEPTGHVNAQVRGGLYSILIGNTAIPGMGDLNASVFQQHDDVHLRVWFSDGVNGFERIVPDRPFAAVPYALSAGSADIAPGSISLNMLESDVQNSLNGTITDGTITKSMLSQEVLNELNSSSGGGGVVPGSLLAVPRNQSAPSGYSLYQSGEPKDLVWEEKAPVSVARYAFDGVEVLGGKIYFVGGKDGSSAKNIAERYDPANNTWETLANMSAPREGVACAVLNEKLYAIGGVGLTSVEVFDPSNTSWTAGTALPSEIRHGTALTVNGKIYLIGGKNASSQYINQVLSFDSSTSQWSTKANMPTAREGMKLVWFENRIWAIGGSDGSHTNKVESYDPASDTWQTEASLQSSRWWPVSWVANGRIYVGGGKDGSSVLNSIEVYDPATKQWISAGNLPEVNWVADSVVLNDKAYVVSGATATGVFSNKVFAADLNASVSGVFDLYRKDGNASSGVPTVQAEVADGSVTASKIDPSLLNELNSSSGVGGVVPGSLLAVPYGSDAPAGYSLYQRGEPRLVWQEKAPVSVARLGGDGVEAINGRIYFVGGQNSSAQSRNFEYYQELTNEWLELAELSEDRDGVSTVILNNELYLIGGRNVSSVKKYNLLTNSWSSVASLPLNLRYADAIVFNNRIYLIGGISDSDQKLNNVFEFSPTSNEWLAKANMPTPRFGARLALLDSKIWAIGGNDNSHVRKVEIYDPIQNSWVSGPSLSNQRHAPVTWVLNGKIYVGGGFSSNFGYQDSIEVYDPALKKWIHYGNFPEPKYYADSVILNDTVYVIAGFTGNNIYSNKVFAADLNASVSGVFDLYRKDGNASSGVPVAQIANGSITTNQLSEQILKYLKPEITQQPTAGTIFADTNHTFSVSAEGKYLTYQWKKNGVNLTGETNATLTITDANSTQHDGNYTVVVSNDFGSMESGEETFIVLNTLMDGLIAWYPLDQNASDMSGLNNHGTLKNTPQFVTQGGKSFVTLEAAGDSNDSGDHILLPFSNFSPFTQITISGWLNFINSSHSGDHSAAIISFGDHTAGLIGVFAFNTGTNSGFGFAINRTTLTLRGVQNTWVHFLITGDQETCAGYLNAENVGTGSGLGSYSGGNAAIGRDWWDNGLSTGTRLNGSLDEIRIYNRAMSATEVQALYQFGQ
jgi:N-acetylneuraminic acid mutarotase